MLSAAVLRRRFLRDPAAGEDAREEEDPPPTRASSSSSTLDMVTDDAALCLAAGVEVSPRKPVLMRDRECRLGGGIARVQAVMEVVAQVLSADATAPRLRRGNLSSCL